MKGKGEFVLTARTTVDVPLQKLAEQAIETTFEREGRRLLASTNERVVVASTAMLGPAPCTYSIQE